MSFLLSIVLAHCLITTPLLKRWRTKFDLERMNDCSRPGGFRASQHNRNTTEAGV